MNFENSLNFLDTSEHLLSLLFLECLPTSAASNPPRSGAQLGTLRLPLLLLPPGSGWISPRLRSGLGAPSPRGRDADTAW